MPTVGPRLHASTPQHMSSPFLLTSIAIFGLKPFSAAATAAAEMKPKVDNMKHNISQKHARLVNGWKATLETVIIEGLA